MEERRFKEISKTINDDYVIINGDKVKVHSLEITEIRKQQVLPYHCLVSRDYNYEYEIDIITCEELDSSFELCLDDYTYKCTLIDCYNYRLADKTKRYRYNDMVSNNNKELKNIQHSDIPKFF